MKNYIVFDLSGPFKYYLFGKWVIFLIQKFNHFFNNTVLISCDAEPFLVKNSINIWFGGTSNKIPHEFTKFKNNCHVFDNFIKQEENLLKLYPYNLSSFFHRVEPKIIFIGDFTNYNYSIVDEIWLKEKDNEEAKRAWRYVGSHSGRVSQTDCRMGSNCSSTKLPHSISLSSTHETFSTVSTSSSRCRASS